MTTDAQRLSAEAPSQAALAFESFREFEVLHAPRTLTGNLFHYTNDRGLSGILTSGKLRLSPYQFTNDLWESQPHYPSFSSRSEADPGPGMALFEEVDRQLRLHTKVGCLTQDVTLPKTVANPDALRGWAHLALWAHYGAGHEGCALSSTVSGSSSHSSSTPVLPHWPSTGPSATSAASTAPPSSALT
ncbi:hypothetical protein ACFVZZ_23685 [Streptomyces chartreusis]|uniref:hypothetical protein n=1 Tax=Streptomyces chartreusis TaxID=1969 RepID=UPI0036DB6ECA